MTAPGGFLPRAGIVPFVSLLDVVIAALLAVSTVILLDLGRLPSPLSESVGSAHSLAVITGYAATLTLVLATGAMVTLLVARIAHRIEPAHPRLAGVLLMTAVLLPLGCPLWRSCHMLFEGGWARRHSLGGWGPILAMVACALGLSLVAKLLKRQCRWDQRTGLAQIGLLAGIPALAIGFRTIDAGVYPGHYIHLHQLLAILTHTLLLTGFLAVKARIVAGGPPVGGVRLRPGLALVAMMTLGTLAFHHLQRFRDADPSVRRLIGQRMMTSGRFAPLLPYHPEPEPTVESRRVSTRRRTIERLGRQAVAELDRIREDRRATSVILISVDAIRADHTSLGGYERDTTPFMASIAKESFVFTSARSPSTASFFSLMSTLSGVHPSTISSLRGRDPAFLSKHLGARGFSTACFYHEVIFSIRPSDWPPPELTLGFAHVERSNSRATPTLASIWKTIEGSKPPWFVFTHLMDPHSAYEKCAGFDFGDGAIDRYDSEIAHVDREIGRFWDRLRESGLDDSTILVITADHGEAFDEHGVSFHCGMPYEEQCHVPLLIRVPFLRDRARVVDAPVTTTSLAATLTDLVGLPELPGVEAPSLLSLMLGIDGSHDVYSVVEVPGLTQTPSKPVSTAIVEGRYKMIHELKLGTREIYDLAADPRELHDLAGERPDLLEALAATEREWRSDRILLREPSMKSADRALPIEYLQLREEVAAGNFARLGAFLEFLAEQRTEVFHDACGVVFDIELRHGPGSPVDLGSLVPTSRVDEFVETLVLASRFAHGAGDFDPRLLLLHDFVPPLRRRVARALRRGVDRIDDSTRIAAHLEVEEDESIRRELICFLTDQGDDSRLDELFDLAGVSTGEALDDAVSTLLRLDDTRLGERLDGLVRHDEVRVRQAALLHVGEIDTPARRRILDELLASDRFTDRRLGIQAADRYRDPTHRTGVLARVVAGEADALLVNDALMALVLSVRDDTPERRSAIDALLKVKAVRDRKVAVEQILEFPDPRFRRERLLWVLRNEKNRSLRGTAGAALLAAETPMPLRRDIIDALLVSGRGADRMLAVTTLVEIPDRAFQRSRAEALLRSERSREIREKAAEILNDLEKDDDES